MINPQKMTYENSYLFSEKDAAAATERRKLLMEFILKYERIEDKSSDAFRGIVEDVKRMQRTSILYTILMSDQIVLCYGQKEMPRAFKVVEMKDIKNDKTPKVFIDVTGLITYKDGYYVCRKVDVLVSYLFCALNYLLYDKAGLKLMNNSGISISGTECFVAMFTYILDYLRIIGYAQNKEKISYLAGLYFLNHMMGKDIDNYCKNIAARTAGLSTMDTKAFELYYDAEKDFLNIDTFISLISTTFKLKGFDTEVFVAKWMYSFKATGYDSELFTSFANLIINAYSGSYIVNQKQIERCCGASMVKFCTSILQLGVAEFDNRGYMEQSELEALAPRDKATEALREAIMKKFPEEAKVTKEDFKSKETMASKAKAIITYYRTTEKEGKIADKIYTYSLFGFNNLNKGYEVVAAGALEAFIKPAKQYIKNDERISNMFNELITGASRKVEQAMNKYRDKSDKEKASVCAKRLVELRKLYSLI